jgi:hypothetical protein
LFLSAVASPATYTSYPTNLVFGDNFANDSAVNANLWNIPTWTSNGSTYLGQTQLRTSQNSPPPVVRNGTVRLDDDSYNPTGLSFYGTELVSNRTFRIANSNWDGLILSVTAELHPTVTLPNIEGGVVGGLFLYGLKSDGHHDEVDDAEILTNQLVAGTNQGETNVFADAPFTSAGSPQYNSLPSGGTLSQFHTYTAACYSNEIQFFIDGTLVQTYTGAIPSGPMQAMLNIWTPDSTWPAAYNANISATNNPADDLRWRMDVSNVQIYRIEEPLSPPVTGTPGIKITSTANGYASGTVTGVIPANYQVATYIDVNGGWWTKPYFDEPLTAIQSNGSWTADIVTGGDDAEATEVIAYLVPSGTTVPLASGGGLSSSLSSYPYSEIAI